MPTALVVYATRNGETRKIGELIAEGLRFSMVDVTIRDVKELKTEADIEGYDGYLFGSSTYHGEMMTSMKSFLFLAEKGDLKGKPGGSFGSYGWSGEAAERIYDTMKNIYQMDMVSSPLMLKAVSIDGGKKASHDYGKEVAAKLHDA